MTAPSPQLARAYIALGSNLGDRAATIAAALTELSATPNISVTKVSRLLENPAVGGPPNSPPFLNAAAEIQTTLPPHDLLARLLQIESDLGRRRLQKWEPRLIDLDLLLYGNQIINDTASPHLPPSLLLHCSTARLSAALRLPHPHLHLRRFVLAPLAEIAPTIIHPTFGKTIQSLLDELPPPNTP